MEKIKSKVLYVVLMIIFPGVVFAETPDDGMDMKVYTTFLSYGLLFLVFVIFSVLIYHTSGEQKRSALPEVKVIPKAQEIAIVYNNAGLAGMMKYLGIIYYAVILLITMYVIMLVFTII